MKRAKREKTARLVIAILVAVSGVLAIPGIVLFAIFGRWVLMALCCALTVHTFYGVTFYFLAFAAASRRYRVISAVELHGLRSVGSISEFCVRPPEAVVPDLLKCLERGYISGLVLRGDTLVPIESEAEGEEKKIKCVYCGLTVDAEDGFCPNCAAPLENPESE